MSAKIFVCLSSHSISLVFSSLPSVKMHGTLGICREVTFCHQEE